MKYELIVHADKSYLRDLTGVIIENGGEIVAMKSIEANGHVADPRKIKAPRKAPHRTPGKNLNEIVLSIFADGKKHTTESIGKRIARMGFSENSSPPTISTLRRANKLVQIDQHTYQLVAKKD